MEKNTKNRIKNTQSEKIQTDLMNLYDDWQNTSKKGKNDVGNILSASNLD